MQTTSLTEESGNPPNAHEALQHSLQYIVSGSTDLLSVASGIMVLMGEAFHADRCLLALRQEDKPWEEVTCYGPLKALDFGHIDRLLGDRQQSICVKEYVNPSTNKTQAASLLLATFPAMKGCQGLLCLEMAYEQRIWSVQEKQVLQSIMPVVALGVERCQLYAELARSRHQTDRRNVEREIDTMRTESS